MSYRIGEIEGIEPKYRAKLEGAGIRTTGELIQACCTEHGRIDIAESTGVSMDRLLCWVRLADLMRIDGVGRQFAELLDACGVRTIEQMRIQRADDLARRVRSVNESRRLSRTTPSSQTIERWIWEARDLPPRIGS